MITKGLRFYILNNISNIYGENEFRRLLIAILEDAKICLDYGTYPKYKRSKRVLRDFFETIAWIHDDREYLFSLRFVCNYLDLNYYWIRDKYIDFIPSKKIIKENYEILAAVSEKLKNRGRKKNKN